MYMLARVTNYCTISRNVRKEPPDIVMSERNPRTCEHIERLDQPSRSVSAFWIAKDAKFLHADDEDSDKTARKYGLM